MKETVFVRGNARFSLLGEGLIRMEYAEDGRFVDEKTLFAENRAHDGSDFTVEDDGAVLKLATARIVLTYDYGTGEGFTAETLKAEIRENGSL